MPQGSHDGEAEDEPQLEKGQGRVVCDRVLDEDEGPAPDRRHHQQKEDVDQWNDCGRRGAWSTSPASRSPAASSVASSRTRMTRTPSSSSGGLKAPSCC